jgi:hypothetical protein
MMWNSKYVNVRECARDERTCMFHAYTSHTWSIPQLCAPRCAPPRISAPRKTPSFAPESSGTLCAERVPLIFARRHTDTCMTIAPARRARDWTPLLRTDAPHAAAWRRFCVHAPVRTTHSRQVGIVVLMYVRWRLVIP